MILTLLVNNERAALVVGIVEFENGSIVLDARTNTVRINRKGDIPGPRWPQHRCRFSEFQSRQEQRRQKLATTDAPLET